MRFPQYGFSMVHRFEYARLNASSWCSMVKGFQDSSTQDFISTGKPLLFSHFESSKGELGKGPAFPVLDLSVSLLFMKGC